DDVFRLHSQALQISAEKRRVGVDVQHARNAHAKLPAVLHERNALSGRLVPESHGRNGVGDARRIGRPEDLVGSAIDEVRISFFDIVQAGFNVLHVIDVFDQTFFTGGGDQTLLAVHERNLGDLLDGNEAHLILESSCDVDKGAQAVVFAKIAARG